MITVQFRSLVNPRIQDFATLADALRYGFSEKEPFDISVESGAIIWVWEQRSQNEGEDE